MQESITLGIVCLARAVQGRACHFFSCRQRHRQEDAVAIPSQRYGAGSSQPLSNDADMLDHEPPLAGSRPVQDARLVSADTIAPRSSLPHYFQPLRSLLQESPKSPVCGRCATQGCLLQLRAGGGQSGGAPVTRIVWRRLTRELLMRLSSWVLCYRRAAASADGLINQAARAPQLLDGLPCKRCAACGLQAELVINVVAKMTFPRRHLTCCQNSPNFLD
eukprot:TRINITY_DN29097_c0_g1_i3.p1 TRINITY_DN29097_c0_g1~~TRINITY_DN29097_c0_g1_i3.p1  ORF type:complete len:219 (+),score=19.80 TRINITY_DN29097_c0_g1_i3:49-705(+)